MSKTPEENEADMEAGMTTAERRRRRRRGGGLRVPSDNVPRRSSSPAVVPIPDDPAMAIAYNAGNGAEATVIQSIDSIPRAPDPVAPEAVTTLIDPPGDEVIEEVSFDSKTREMSAPDLEELGLTEQEREEKRPEVGESRRAPSTVFFDESIADAQSVTAPAIQAPPSAATNPGVPPPPAPSAPVVSALIPSPPILPPSADEPPLPPLPPMVKGRAPTLALSDDDLEELLDENRRAAASEAEAADSGEFEVEMEVDAATAGQGTSAAPAVVAREGSGRARVPERIVVGDRSDRVERAVEASAAGADRTDRTDRKDGADRPEWDRGERSSDRNLGALGLPVTAPLLGTAPPEVPSRAKSTSVPPPTPLAPASASLGAITPPAVSSPSIAPPAAPTALRPAPPPAPVAAKPPPAPPKKVERRPPVAPAAPEEKKRSRAWFAEVFDEDYLRTLPFLTPQATQAEAELVAASLGVSPGAKLLDIGCGYGRHAMELAARGYHVVGLDLSTSLLVRGGEEAHRRGLTINFIRGDMRELDFDGQFDGAYCLFSTFGYFDDETNKKTAGNIARALRPGARCVFEILNRDYIIADLPTRVWWEGDGCVVLEEVDFNYFSSRVCVNRSVVFDDGRQLEQEISIRAYSLHEVGKLMLAAGFRVIEVSGSYQTRGRFFGNQSRHIIVVAERAA